MQIMVVADEQRESIDRKLAHAINQSTTGIQVNRQGVASDAKPYSATLWSETQYKDNESRLYGRSVTVVFVGPSAPALDLADVMPLRFEDLGTTCHTEGHRAVLTARIPASADTDDLRFLAAKLEAATNEIRSEAKQWALVGGAFMGGAAAALLLAPVSIIGLGAAGLVWWRRRQSVRYLRGQVSLAQYEYVVARFLAEELAPLMSDD